MTAKTKVPKRKVALDLAPQSAPTLIINAKQYVQQMTGNVHFPNPPSLATVTTQITALEVAYALSLTRVKGSVAAMHAQRKTLEILLHQLATYVETVANADPDNAESIIKSAGMPMKRPSVHQPKVFSALNGKINGSVVLNSKAVKGGATYIYQMTTDPNTASSWTTIYSATKVKFTKTGLTSGTKYYFRMAQAIKGVQGDWSHELEILVQ